MHTISFLLKLLFGVVPQLHDHVTSFLLEHPRTIPAVQKEHEGITIEGMMASILFTYL